MSLPSLSDLPRHLDTLDIPYTRLGEIGQGCALVIAPGARVLALSAPGSDENVFWTHPLLGQCRTLPDMSHGGIGGLRLWHAPESAYMWQGPAQAATFANYQVQPAMDPGHYRLELISPTSCLLTGQTTLQDLNSGKTCEIAIRREIKLRTAKRSVSLAFENYLTLLRGEEDTRVDLWHLMQLPPGTTVGAKIREGCQPIIYFNPDRADGWTLEGDTFTWLTNGTRLAKIGFDAASGPFAICPSGRFDWIIPIDRKSQYVDSPPGSLRDDQIVQFWDGFDFCEAEYHSPGVSLKNPELTDLSELIYTTP